MAVYWLPFLVFSALLAVGVVALSWSSADLLDAPESAALGGDVLRANVAVSQGMVAVLVLLAAWTAGVPWSAFGRFGTDGLPIAIAAGVVLAGANRLLDRVLPERALRDAARLRERLVPRSLRGWVVLLVVVVPVIAVSEELLFRGALVGVATVGLGVSPWPLVAVSSLVFGAAHSAQGAVGIAVTTVFGLLLASVYVLTGSLIVVIVVHAIVDAMEFVLATRTDPSD